MTNFVSLRVLQDDAKHYVTDMVETINPSLPYRELIEQVTEFNHRFQILATASLLSDDKPQMFFLNLARAGANWVRLQLFCEKQEWQDLSVSHNRFGLGAMIANIQPVINHLYNKSRSTPMLEYENPGDYYYSRLLYALYVNHAGDTNGIEADFAQLQDNPPRLANRIELIQALLDHNQADFEASFYRALEDVDQDIDRLNNSFTTSVTASAVKRHLWLEGIVLLKLARRTGLDDIGFNRYCPEQSLGQLDEPFNGDWEVRLGVTL